AAGTAVDPATLRDGWDRHLDATLAEATLVRPDGGWPPGSGRRGVHSEHLGYLLAELQYLHRLHPGARW
ncbi:MAG TPA: Phenylacetic acid catabolic protein, partial [Actinomycetota bacterium]|nr:Phenylacetic acid catabolic protein [Actinomycetota bacterium]